MLCSLYFKKRIGRLHDSFDRLVKSLAVSAVDDLWLQNGGILLYLYLLQCSYKILIH